MQPRSRSYPSAVAGERVERTHSLDNHGWLAFARTENRNEIRPRPARPHARRPSLHRGIAIVWSTGPTPALTDSALANPHTKGRAESRYEGSTTWRRDLAGSSDTDDRPDEKKSADRRP